MRASLIGFVAVLALWLSLSPSASAQTATAQQCAEAWQAALEQDTLAAYNEFLAYYASCDQANGARARVAPSQDEPAPPSRTGTTEPAAQVSLPHFPWPPPRPSAQMTLPRARLIAALEHNPSLYDVGDHLSRALDDAGYVERSYYAVPNGFALVARLERILDNGRPAPNGFRYLPPGEEPFSLTAYLSGLFVAPVGRYRQIVFVVTDRPFAATGDELDQREASDLLREGADRLPAYFRSIPFGEDYAVASLIYEFEKTGAVGQMRQLPDGRLGAQTHLTRAGIYPLVVH